MTNKELQELLKQYPDGAFVMLDKSVNYPNFVGIMKSQVKLAPQLKDNKDDVILIKVV